jgi:dihydroxy-acid dehydratase
MPCLVDLMPSGRYLMEDFYYAGGLPVVIKEIAQSCTRRAHRQRPHAVGEREGRGQLQPEVITPLAQPFKPQGGIAVLRGNLAPDGAVLKPSAATPALMQHSGRAVVFEDIDDLNRASTIRRSTSNPTTSWCSRIAARRAIPAFPRSATSRCPPRS